MSIDAKGPFTDNGEALPSGYTAELTELTYPGKRMGKVFRWNPATQTVETETDAHGYIGRYQVLSITGMAQLAAYLDSLSIHQIVVSGVPKPEHGHAGKLGNPNESGTIARTKDDGSPNSTGYFIESEKHALVWIDADMDAAPLNLQMELQTPEQIVEYLYGKIPALRGAAVLARPSGSNGVLRPDGTPHKEARNFHIAFVCHGSERQRILQELFDKLASGGDAWLMISSIGSLLRKSFVDRALLSQNQPVFAAPPEIVAPMRSARPPAFVREGRVLALNDLPKTSQAEVDRVYAALIEAPETKAAQHEAKEKWVQNRVDQYFRFTLEADPAERDIVEQDARAVLGQTIETYEFRKIGIDYEITLVDGTKVTPRDMYEDPQSWHMRQTEDPIEPGYRGGGQRGIIYNRNGRLYLKTQAHGGRTFMLEQFERPAQAGLPQFPKPRYVPFDKVGRDVFDGVLNRGYGRSQYHYGSQGTGKTTQAMKALKEMTGIQVVYQNNHGLLEQTVKMLEDRRPWIHMRGFSAPVQVGAEETMCRFPDKVSKLSAQGVDVAATVCPVCPLKGVCAMEAQRQRVKSLMTLKNAVVFAPTASLSREPTGLLAKTDLNIIDENAARALLSTGKTNTHELLEALKVPDYHRYVYPTMLKIAQAFNAGGDFCDNLRLKGVTVQELVFVVQLIEDHIEKACDKEAKAGMRNPAGPVGETPEEAEARRKNTVETREFETRLDNVQLRLTRRELNRLDITRSFLRALVSCMMSDGTPCMYGEECIDRETGELSCNIYWQTFKDVMLDKDVPRIMLDGTGDPLLNEAVFGPADEFYNPVERNAFMVKVTDVKVGKQELTGMFNGAPVQGNRIAQSKRHKGAVIDFLKAHPDYAIGTNKDSRKALVEELGLSPEEEASRFVHVNAVAGLNTLEDRSGILVAGNAVPHWQVIERLARAYACKLGITIETGKPYQTQTRNLRMRNGDAVAVEGRVFSDPFVERVKRQFGAEYDQIADRIRPHTCDKPKVILDLTDSVIDGEYDEIWGFNDFARGAQPMNKALETKGIWASSRHLNAHLKQELSLTKEELAQNPHYIGLIGGYGPALPIVKISFKSAITSAGITTAFVRAEFGEHINKLRTQLEALGKQLIDPTIVGYMAFHVPGGGLTFEQRRNQPPQCGIHFPFDATKFDPSRPA